MKNIFKFSILILFFASIYSCSKENNNNSQVLVTAKVNGVEWGASVTNVTFDKVPALHITIHAESGSSAMNFELYPYTGRGVYLITGSNNAYYLSNTIYNHANTGQVEITDSYSDGNNRTIIKGNFNFVADNNITVTDGLFVVALDLN